MLDKASISDSSAYVELKGTRASFVLNCFLLKLCDGGPTLAFVEGPFKGFRLLSCETLP
jgi:hypothetical protein